ncbi:hypothetical protein CG724_03755 [Streptomyces sp. CB02120-2]|nr:hypothetical protein CG724_03755 [Streptomyces sp. CB02120-2]
MRHCWAVLGCLPSVPTSIDPGPEKLFSAVRARQPKRWPSSESSLTPVQTRLEAIFRTIGSGRTSCVTRSAEITARIAMARATRMTFTTPAITSLAALVAET